MEQGVSRAPVAGNHSHAPEDPEMRLQLKPLHPLFAAEASGIDLREPVDAALASEIDAAMDAHAVLVLRGQPLEPGEQVAFAQRFGTLASGLKKLNPGQPSRMVLNRSARASFIRFAASLALEALACASRFWRVTPDFRYCSGSCSDLSFS